MTAPRNPFTGKRQSYWTGILPNEKPVKNG
jgi:hypothetical protein